MLRTAVYLFVLACAVVQGFTVAQRIADRAQQQVAALAALAVDPARVAATTTTTATATATTSADAMRAALGL